jgi:DtxR family Mn-dependent transcriptional regulator
MPNPGEHQPAFDEYCECIFDLREDNLEVIQARIADRLRVSRPSVSEMVRRMQEEGLIRLDGNHILLTPHGEQLARRVVRRHRLAERFLTDILDLSWAQAHQEAGKWEHVMSEDVEKAIERLLGNPTTCPHGNPIPGTNYQPPAAMPLSQVGIGQSFTVSRIPEELEFIPGMLEFLEEYNLIPGGSGKVAGFGTTGDMSLEVNGTQVDVESFATQRILVTL